MRHIAVGLPDGGWLAATPDLSALTTYVLLEQGDWLEPELAFVRALARPGMHAIDIGAGEGLYTLALARGMEDSGTVWAFESRATAYAQLRDGISMNNVDTRVRALPYLFGGDKSRPGRGTDSTLNGCASRAHARCSLTRGSTVDDQMPALIGGVPIDFVRIDANGDEARVIRGAARFLARQSPLVMFAVRQGQGVTRDAIGALRALGFAIFRLAPGAGVLMPVNVQAGMELQERLLFAAKPDCAAALQARGLLVAIHSFGDGPAPHRRWQEDSALWPYAQRQEAQQAVDWRAGEASDLHALALDAYVSARDHGQSAVARMTWLKQAQRLWVQLHQSQPENHSYTLCLARVSHDLGERAAALGLVMRLERSLAHWGEDERVLPALSPLPRRDAVQVCGGLENWMRMSVTEAVESWRSPSSYFTSDSCTRLLPHLDNVDMSRDMHRRYCLHAQRTGVPLGLRDLRRACASSSDPLMDLLPADLSPWSPGQRRLHAAA